MKTLTNIQLNQVGGGNACHVNTVAAGVVLGASVGFLLGGPIGAAAGAVSAGGHALVGALIFC
jgi:fructose-specific phosphotransferase system IIC component